MQASTANPLCANCHSTGFSDTQLAASRASYINALGVLQAQLAAKGYVYSPNPPYFANTNWGAGQTGANNMGAAFNYLLLLFEPGAFAHNPAYAKKLIFDSIDFLYNGTLTGSIDSALNSLVASGAITPAAAQSMTSYNSTSSSCISCHGGTASTPAPMATNAHPAHLTSSYGPGGYLGSALASCQTCHSFTSTTHRNGAVDLINGAGSSCAGCHPGGLPAWTSTSRIACTVCHAATPSKLPNGVAAPNKPYFAAAGHGRFGASNACTSCHDPNSPHISGSLGVNMRLFTTDDNTQCASCHNQTTAPRMSTHVLDKNATPTPSLCNSCHDPHGTTNAFMIRSTINGVAISFTNASTSFVQTTAPYKGLCQVCHTLTTHFRAGQLPDGHPTRNCLSCHSHTAAAFAFAPAGNCDSCHGYPPAPAGFVGTTGNYIGARAQDYLGGAGAHMIAAHVKPTALPSEGWANCTGCHGNGAINPVTHTMIMPVNPSKVTINMDDRFKYNATLPLGPQQYTGVLADGGANATGSCFNVKCHFKSSKKWSTQK
jgi:predicted CXXCH cytochrome family protein